MSADKHPRTDVVRTYCSCSTRGTISLNYKLLFLPRPLVRYVLLHELCHTRQSNHAVAFWALVAQ